MSQPEAEIQSKEQTVDASAQDRFQAPSLNGMGVITGYA